ncbi:hypothetical protein [Duganella hordei]|uniref:hypothetical protein n=1 Tax=Duganella hordei TaxID=2865934 RepID=UPI0030E867B8
MKALKKIALATLVGVTMAATLPAVAETPAKNWTAPSYKIYAQTLSDEIMAAHPELISVTFHGVPPGMSKVYTMFAGSYPDRIGNPDDPDDVMIIETGITILDPRWHRTKDAIRKYVPMLPLRDAAGENIGLLVLAYKNPADAGYNDEHFFKASMKLRDELQKKIPSYAALFQQAK